MPTATLESVLRILMRRRTSHIAGTRAAIHATIAALRVARHPG